MKAESRFCLEAVAGARAAQNSAANNAASPNQFGVLGVDALHHRATWEVINDVDRAGVLRETEHIACRQSQRLSQHAANDARVGHQQHAVPVVRRHQLANRGGNALLERAKGFSTGRGLSRKALQPRLRQPGMTPHHLLPRQSFPLAEVNFPQLRAKLDLQTEAVGGNYQTLINRVLREHVDRGKQPTLEETLRRVIREELWTSP